MGLAIKDFEYIFADQATLFKPAAQIFWDIVALHKLILHLVVDYIGTFVCLAWANSIALV